VNLQPLGTVFVSMITMVVTPIIFVTIVGGIAGVDDLRKVGRIGVKSLIYFEGMTTVALILGLVAMNLFHPGTAIHADPASLKLTGSAATYAAQGKEQGFWSILTEIVPTSALGAFSTGNDLQVVFFAILFGIAIKLVGALAVGIANGVNRIGLVFFAILRIVMYAAPVGAFGAMAFTVGKYGLHTLTSLGSLIGLMIRHQRGVRPGRPRRGVRRVPPRHPGSAAVHQGRADHRARHVLQRDRPAAADAQDRARRGARGRGRP